MYLFMMAATIAVDGFCEDVNRWWILLEWTDRKGGADRPASLHSSISILVRSNLTPITVVIRRPLIQEDSAAPIGSIFTCRGFTGNIPWLRQSSCVCVCFLVDSKSKIHSVKWHFRQQFGWVGGPKFNLMFQLPAIFLRFLSHPPASAGHNLRRCTIPTNWQRSREINTQSFKNKLLDNARSKRLKKKKVLENWPKT